MCAGCMYTCAFLAGLMHLFCFSLVASNASKMHQQHSSLILPQFNTTLDFSGVSQERGICSYVELQVPSIAADEASCAAPA